MRHVSLPPRSPRGRRGRLIALVFGSLIPVVVFAGPAHAKAGKGSNRNTSTATQNAATYAVISINAVAHPYAKIDVWRNNKTGRLTFQYPGSSEARTLDGTTLKDVVQDRVVSIDNYKTRAAAWRVLNELLGVRSRLVATALAHGSQTQEPAISEARTSATTARLSDGSSVRTHGLPYTIENHLGVNLAGLQRAVGFEIPTATNVAGYALMDTAATHFYGSGRKASGGVASLWYSKPGTAAGALNSEVEVNVASAGGSIGSWGRVYRALLARPGTLLVGPGYAARMVDGTQVVFERSPNVYEAITTSWTPNRSEWDALLSATSLQSEVTLPSQSLEAQVRSTLKGSGVVGNTLYCGDGCGGGGGYTHSDSNCYYSEDPQNMRFYSINAKEYNPNINLTYPVAAYTAAADIANAYWTGGLGSTSSYFLFSSSNGGCRNQSSYATNSWTSGWHVRFWEGTTYITVQGAAHHDFYCSATGKHGSNLYPDAAYYMGVDFVNWQPGAFSRADVSERAPATGVSCGTTWSDDGYTQRLTQQVSSITTIF